MMMLTLMMSKISKDFGYVADKLGGKRAKGENLNLNFKEDKGSNNLF